MSMDVICIWSHIEADLTSLVTEHFTESDFTIVAAMLNALIGTEGRRTAVREAAKEALSADELSLFLAVEKAISGSRNTRNAFAHGLWGWCLDITEPHMLWINPKDFQRTIAGHKHNIQIIEAWKADPERPVELPSLPYKPLDLTKVLVYLERDFTEAVVEAKEANSLVRLLRWALSGLVDAEEARQMLIKRLTPTSPRGGVAE